MSLLDALVAGVAVANTVTKQGKLQATVLFSHCVGSDQYGPIYAAPVPLLVILDQTQKQVRDRSGVLSASSAQLQFLDPTAIAAATPGDGRIRDIDLIQLPDGSQGAIMSVGGYVNGVTGYAVAPMVYIA
jgi:hypothetical protein